MRGRAQADHLRAEADRPVVAVVGDVVQGGFDRHDSSVERIERGLVAGTGLAAGRSRPPGGYATQIVPEAISVRRGRGRARAGNAGGGRGQGPGMTAGPSRAGAGPGDLADPDRNPAARGRGRNFAGRPRLTGSGPAAGPGPPDEDLPVPGLRPAGHLRGDRLRELRPAPGLCLRGPRGLGPGAAGALGPPAHGRGPGLPRLRGSRRALPPVQQRPLGGLQLAGAGGQPRHLLHRLPPQPRGAGPVAAVEPHPLAPDRGRQAPAVLLAAAPGAAAGHPRPVHGRAGLRLPGRSRPRAFPAACRCSRAISTA